MALRDLYHSRKKLFSPFTGWKWHKRISGPLSRQGNAFRFHQKRTIFAETIDSCPEPTCPCAETPLGLKIDRIGELHGSIPTYNKHIVVCTGKADWASRIQDDTDCNFAKEYQSQPKTEIKNLVTNSSFPSLVPSIVPSLVDDPSNYVAADNSVYLFPAFKFFPRITVQKMAEVLPICTKLNSIRFKNNLHVECLGLEVHNVRDVVILICGHASRDERCGILGPLLHSEFKRQLTKTGFRTDDDARLSTYRPGAEQKLTAKVGLTSHIGGHKYAGNVIIYIPLSFTPRKTVSPIAGKGLWYGRVEPKHVEGIIRETILGGRIIKDMLRGTR